MVRAPVDAINDGVGCTFQLIVEATLHQPAQHWLVGLIAVKGEASDVGLSVHPAHRSVHPFDDIATDAEVAQGWLEAGLQGPLRQPDLFRQSEPFEPGDATHHQTAKLRIFAGGAGAKIGDPAALVEMSRSDLSRLVQRSASTSFPRALRISCSLRGPNSSVTRSAARSRKPLLM